ncbi:histidinol-phosphate transaminase [Amnibacterium sp. CER49]|uniref:histidinol-phosphate transaminase n=1 Tax=Amnibacterium sp. CER49 TaxID=3039161 RepID=UPI00244A2D59|nr:histidinol-phosphate transaminase [Amnibacterium sp. CER49]MDH2444984.1 histidinol-phosphate transaminase [Amnibacterium sp. CER49]
MTNLADLPLRPDLVGRSPYGAPQLSVPVALNVNENTHPVPPEVADDILRRVGAALTEVNRYPDREFTALREALAGYLGHGLGAESIWAANGSNEVIQHVLQAFGGPGRRVLGFPPTYSMHAIIAASTATEWVPAERDDDFRISPETAVAAIERTDPDLVFLCAPNNPTGTPVGLDTIAAAYDATDGIVFVDEAYGEFMPDDAPSALTLLPGRPRLIVSRTMSKAFAFAGARVGYLAADPAVADALRLVRLPYHLSALTQAAALGALAHAPTMLGMVDDIREQRDRMAAGIEGFGYRVWPSWTNFLLFGGVADPKGLWRALLERGVLIRDLAIPGTLRVSAGTPAETDAFLDALAAVSAAPVGVRA